MNLFFDSVEKEKLANSHKGDWDEWSPHEYELFWEMQEHVAKLQLALKKNNFDDICKYSCAIALYSEKAFTVFGKPTECRGCKGKGERIFDSPYLSICSDCNGTGVKSKS